MLSYIWTTSNKPQKLLHLVGWFIWMFLNDFEMRAFSKATEKLKKQSKLFIWPATLYLMSSVPACQNISVLHPTTVSQLCKNTAHVEYQYQKFCVYLKSIKKTCCMWHRNSALPNSNFGRNTANMNTEWKWHIQTIWGGKVSIWGGSDSIGHCEKNVYLSMCPILITEIEMFECSTQYCSLPFLSRPVFRRFLFMSLIKANFTKET
jgi:hypothetical protein